jgi:integrase
VTVRKEDRDGKSRWVIDIPYTTAAGKGERYRRDAQVQTKTGAELEHRNLLAELARAGTLKRVKATREVEPAPVSYTFGDAVRHYRATYMKTALKPSTRISYEDKLNRTLVPRFGELPIEAVNGPAVALLDAELVDDELLPGTRTKYQIVVRSVLREAVLAGLLAEMPKLPRLPKVGRKMPRPMRRGDLDAILQASRPAARLAFELAAFAGLRASEVRGLRWSDVDLPGRAITVRRGITSGIETTPKSHHQRRIPMSRELYATLAEAAKAKRGPWAPVALTRQGKPWGESGLNQAFKRARKRAGRLGWSFHDLRHFFVTELFRRKAPAPAVQQLAGHADLTTTQRYADFDANDLRSAIECFDGNGVETALPVAALETPALPES